MNSLRRGRLLALAVVSAAFLAGDVGTPPGTLRAEGIMPPRFVALLQRSSVFIVTPARLDVASGADAITATAWHTFRVQETLSTASRRTPLNFGSCKQPDTSVALAEREIALPFTGGTVASDVVSHLPREWGRFKPEVGRRYLVVVHECGAGIGLFPFGPSGFAELDAAGRIVPGRWTNPEARELGTVNAVRQLIADLASADRDTPSAILVGRTIDALSGQPVGGAMVRLRGLRELAAQSTADGWFLFRDVPAFSYLIDARKDGWVRRDAQTPAEQIRLAPGERRADVSLPMHRAPDVRVTVVDENGLPLGGAQVLAIPLGDPGAVPRRMGGGFGGRADEQGRRAIDGLAPGEYLVAASLNPIAQVERDDRPGRRFYPTTFYPGGTAPSGAAVFTLRADDAPREVAISVKSIPARRIAGRIRHPAMPVGGILLRLDYLDPLFDLDRTGGGFGRRSDRTAADGTFVFDDLPPGEYIVSLTVSGEPPESWFSRRVTVGDRDVRDVTIDVPDAVMAQVGARRAAPTAASQLASTGTSRVEGVVRDTADGRPMARTLVTLLNMATGVARRVETDSDGSFSFARVSSGHYVVSGTRDGYIPAEARDGTPLRVELDIGNGAGVRAQLEMTRGGVITGTVFDETGAPVRGAEMAFRRFVVQDGVPTLRGVTTNTAGFELGIPPGATDREGRYRIAGLPRGDYVVSALAPARDRSVAQVTQDEIGRVLADLRRKPLASSGSSASMPAPAASRATPPVATGARTPPVPLPTFHPDTTDALRATRVQVAPGVEAAGVDIHLAPPSSAKIRFRVASIDGLPVYAIARVIRIDLRTEGTIAADRGENGTYVVRGIPPGRYAIIAQAPAAPPERNLWARVDLDVGTSDIDDIGLVLQPTSTVRGRVVVEDSAGPIGAARLAVSLRPIAPTVAAGSLMAAIGPDGTFTVPGVMPGRFRIALEPGGNAPLTWTVRSVAVGGVELRDDVLEIIEGAADPAEVVVRLGPR